MNTIIKRLAAGVVMAAVAVGATVQWGIPKVGYQQPENSETVMTIDGSAVSREEFSYFLSTMYQNMEAQGYTAELFSDETTGPAMVSYLFENAVNQEKMWHTILNLYDEAGRPKIDRMTLDAANQMKKDDIENAGGRDAWEASLEAAGLSERMYDNSVAITVYMQMLYDAYYGEEGTKFNTADQRAYFDDNYVVCKHILFAKTDDSGAALDEASLIEKRAEADEVLAALKAGGDFEALMNEHTDDTGALVSYPDGYVLTEGSTSLTGFVEAAKALEIGDYSDVVETELGWSIIRRYPTTDELFDEYSDEVISLATGSDLYTELQAAMDEAVVEYTDAYGDDSSYENLMSYINA